VIEEKVGKKNEERGRICPRRFSSSTNDGMEYLAVRIASRGKAESKTKKKSKFGLEMSKNHTWMYWV
jgi:hypothetical protein